EAAVLELPRPQGDVVAANLVVLSDDNVELVAQPEEMNSLAPRAARPQMKLPERQQDAIYFRTTGPAPRFAAAVKRHEQAISAELGTQLEIGEHDARVDERIVFQIAYQPTDRLILNVPLGISPEHLTVLQDNERLTLTPLRSRGDGNDEVTPMRVNLGGPRIGRCELAIHYLVRREGAAPRAQTRFVVPLVAPAQVQVTGNELVVVPKPGLEVSYPPGAWNADSTGAAARPTGLVLRARRALPSVALAVTPRQGSLDNATAVTPAWIQTRLTDSVRQDRMLLRVATTAPTLELGLPEGADRSSLEVQVDGRRVVPESARRNEVTLALAGPSAGEYLLEVRYHFADRQSP